MKCLHVQILNKLLKIHVKFFKSARNTKQKREKLRANNSLELGQQEIEIKRDHS